MNNINLGQLVSQITGIVTTIVGLALLVLVAGAVLAKFGVRASFLPSVNPTELAYLAGAWWLYRGRA